MSAWVLITGGCGFVGTNLAHRLMSDGMRVCVLDNLSRAGAERNLEWLRARHGQRLQVRLADTRDAAAMREAVRHATHVFHFAAQVAVTTSLERPLDDFEINAGGTLNMLEAVRTSSGRPPLFFTSTNKVYGSLEDVDVDDTGTRYQPAQGELARYGVAESRPIEFHSPYGCSKGTADQYVQDYARSYGLQTVVFRMSCVYGPHQFGTEDQGWVAHFLIRALHGEPITIYGDGKQVRDLLYVDDLVEAFLCAAARIESVAGQVFNIGGGPRNTVSLRELMRMIEGLDRRSPKVEWSNWRTGDQKYYVSDTRRFEKLTGWRAAVRPQEGLRRLRDWLMAGGAAAVVQPAGDRPFVAEAAAPAARPAIDRPIATIPVAE